MKERFSPVHVCESAVIASSLSCSKQVPSDIVAGTDGSLDPPGGGVALASDAVAEAPSFIADANGAVQICEDDAILVGPRPCSPAKSQESTRKMNREVPGTKR